MGLLNICHDFRYCSKLLFSTIPTPAYDIGQGHGLTNFMFKFASKFLCCFFFFLFYLVYILYNYRCWSKILLSPIHTPADDLYIGQGHQLKNFMLKLCVKVFKLS